MTHSKADAVGAARNTVATHTATRTAIHTATRTATQTATRTATHTATRTATHTATRTTTHTATHTATLTTEYRYVCSRIRGELVELRALKVTSVFVSLACPISSEVLINAERSEESLQHTTTHAATLRMVIVGSCSLGTATHCNTLQHTATHGNTLQHTATHCNTLQHTATHCNKL